MFFFVTQTGQLHFYNVSLVLKSNFSGGVIKMYQGFCVLEKFKLILQNLSNYLIFAESSNLKMNYCYFLKNNFIFLSNQSFTAFIANIGSGGYFFFENLNFVMNYMNVQAINFTGDNHSIIVKSIFAAYNSNFGFSFTSLSNSNIIFEDYFNIYANQLFLLNFIEFELFF